MTADGEQLALALPHRAALGREDFLVAPANAAAVAWLDAWPDWPSAGLVVWGASGSGKSHLAASWCLRSAARRIDGASLTVASVPDLLGDARAVLLEDVDRQPLDERAWLHLHNLIVERRAQMLLTARVAPVRWQVTLPDLASRVKALAAVEISDPDEALIEAVFIKQLADRQLRVPPETVRYIVARLERSLAAVARIVARLDSAMLAAQRAPTIPLAREVLQAEGFSS